MTAAIPFDTFPQFTVGPLTIRTFGLFVALGIVVGVWLFLRYARDRGLDADLLSRLAWWVILLGIIGSRALFVVTHWSEFQDDPLSMFAVWQGGLQFSGAFLISIVVIVWFTRRHPEMPGLTVSDGIVYGLAPGLAIGRLGCIAVGEHLGTATTFPLGWRYTGGETRELVDGGVGSVVHNTAVYELLLLLPLIGVLWYLQRRRVTPGWLTVTFLLWYGVQRFVTDFFRAYDETVAGLTGAQYLCLGMVAGGLLLAVRLRRRGSMLREPAPSDDPEGGTTVEDETLNAADAALEDAIDEAAAEALHTDAVDKAEAAAVLEASAQELAAEAIVEEAAAEELAEAAVEDAATAEVLAEAADEEEGA